MFYSYDELFFKIYLIYMHTYIHIYNINNETFQAIAPGDLCLWTTKFAHVPSVLSILSVPKTLLRIHA